MNGWPESVARVARFLAEAKVEARVQEFHEGTASAEDAANAAGCKLEQIVKTLVLSCDARWIVALVPGDRRADRTKIARAAGCARARVAGPEDVRRVTGFAAGGVCPFPLPGVDTVLADRRLLVHPVVWIGAGSPRHVAALAPGDLVRLSRAREADLVAEEL